MNICIDFGITNTDIIISNDRKKKFHTLPSNEISENYLEKIFQNINIKIEDVKNIAVTGGKSSDLDDSFKSVPVTKINEIDAIGYGAMDLYKIKEKSFVVVSAGTGTACVYFDGINFNHLGGISVGGGMLKGLAKYILNISSIKAFEKLALSGNRKNIDYLIGDVVNDIGSLYPGVTAANFSKLTNDSQSEPDIAASLANMIGEVIGTVSYLNTLLCNEKTVYFLGRTSINPIVKKGIEDRLKLANISGKFEENREYGNVMGALKIIEAK